MQRRISEGASHSLSTCARATGNAELAHSTSKPVLVPDSASTRGCAEPASLPDPAPTSLALPEPQLARLSLPPPPTRHAGHGLRWTRRTGSLRRAGIGRSRRPLQPASSSKSDAMHPSRGRCGRRGSGHRRGGGGVCHRRGRICRREGADGDSNDAVARARTGTYETRHTKSGCGARAARTMDTRWRTPTMPSP